MFTTLICAVSLAALLYAAWYYAHSPINKSRAIVLWSIRAFAVAAVLCAFFQPSCAVRTIAPNTQGLTVILDVSKSMRLFNADSSVSKTLKLLRAFASEKSRNILPVHVVWFGDSARSASLDAHTDFSDCHSYFPPTLEHGIHASDRSVLIISDGNWSNSMLPPTMFIDKNCRYLRLPSFTPQPFLKTFALSDVQRVTQDSAFSIRFFAQGYARRAGKLSVSAQSLGKQLARQDVAIAAGYFGDTVSIRLPSHRPGRYLYRIDVGDALSGLTAVTYIPCDIVPHRLKARIYSARPTLDNRFLALALSKNADWDFAAYKGAAPFDPDALFILDWDNAAQKAAAALKPASVAAFIGCAPDTDKSATHPDTFAIVSQGPDDSLARRLQSQRMPPPATIVIPGNRFFAGMHRLVGCVLQKAIPHDTLPFLALGEFRGRSALFCAAGSAWQMEFLPLSVDNENETDSFLDYLIGLVKKQALANLNRNFFMYPSASGLYVGDSIDFRIIAPAQLDADAAGSARVRCSITRAGVSFIDTSFSPSINPVSGDQLVRLPPLDTGAYVYKALFSSKTVTLAYADTFRVQTNDLEMSVREQNTLLLNSCALSMEITDTSGFRLLITRDTTMAKNVTVNRTMQIKQSWWLLIIVFFLFGLEWVLRRKTGLDS
jgi:hypothetical protein